MTKQDRNEKIVNIMDRLVETRREYGALIANLRDAGLKMEIIGNVLKTSPTALKISNNNETITTPSDQCGNQESILVSELISLAGDIMKLSALSQEISRGEQYLKDVGYDDLIK